MAKTLRSRIAAVAVAALGAGLLSAAPASAAAGDSMSFVSLSPVRAGSGVNATLKLAASASNVGNVDLAKLKVDVLSSPSAAAQVTVGTATLNAAGAASSIGGAGNLSTTSTSYNVQADTAGTYQLVVFEDIPGGTNNILDPTEPYAIFSFTTTGAPSSLTLTGPTGATKTGDNGSFTVVALDANGKATQLTAGEWVAITIGAPGTVSTATIAEAGFASGSATFNAASASAGSVTVTATPKGLFTGSAATATFTTAAYAYATALDITSTSGVGDTAGLAAGAYPLPVTAANAGVAVSASTATGLTIKFRITGANFSDVIPYSISANGTKALPAGVTATVSTVTLPASVSKTSTVTVTATSAAAGSSYVFKALSGAATNFTYTVTYEAPVVNGTKGSVTLAPTAAVAAKALIGGTAAVTAEVVDAFGDAAAGVNSVWTVTGRNTYSASAVTNASGQATYNVVDKSTSTTALTDTVSVVAASLSSDTFTAAATTTLAYVASVTPASLALTNNGAALGTIPDAVVTMTATAKNAAGVGIQGLPVTFTLPAGVYTAASTNVAYTNNVGVATFAVQGSKLGTVSIGAATGGVSATSTFDVIADLAKPRAITASKTTASVTSSNPARVTFTVTDRYGNPVDGLAVTVSYAGTAGRVSAVNGVIGSVGTTTTAGTITVDVTAANSEAGTGTLTAEFLGADASTATTLGTGAAYPAKAASATVAVTVTADTAAQAALDVVKAQVVALGTTITTIQTAISTLVASITASLTALSASINKIMKKLKIK